MLFYATIARTKHGIHQKIPVGKIPVHVNDFKSLMKLEQGKPIKCQKSKVPFHVLQKKNMLSVLMPSAMKCQKRWTWRGFVFPMQLQPSYKYCTLMHVFAISKINLIIFAFLQQTVQLGNGWNRTTFEKSVPMSTYLVCFAVHQFEWVERISASGKPVSPSAA